MFFSFFILPRDQKREVFEFLNSFKEKFAEIYVELKKNKQSHFLFTFFFFLLSIILMNCIHNFTNWRTLPNGTHTRKSLKKNSLCIFIKYN